MAQATPDFAEMASEELSALDLSGAPAQALEAATTARAAVTELLAVAEQLTADREELDEKRDLVPRAGLDRLRLEAEAEAKTKQADAERKFEKAYKDAEKALIDAAQPTLAGSDREMLGRDSLRTAIGDAEGTAFSARLHGLVTNGPDPEALAAVSTPWFRTFAISRGVPNVDQVVERTRKIAALTALERGGTDKEVLAGAALERLGRLNRAQASAQAAFRAAWS